MVKETPMYLFFDTETTGLPRSWKAPADDVDNWPRLVQIAWILCDRDGAELEKRSLIVAPDGFTVPTDASRIHGISNTRALEEGVPVESALEEFGRCLNQCSCLIAHNLDFDAKVLAAEYIRMGADPGLEDKVTICTKEVSTDFCRLPGRYGYKWPTLEELHRILFGSDFEQNHDALDDVEACARCYFELIKQNVIEDRLELNI